jgi:hypothetical protein
LSGRNRRRKQSAASSREADLQGEALASNKKPSLCVINAHFEPVFNATVVTQIIFQQSVKAC